MGNLTAQKTVKLSENCYFVYHYKSFMDALKEKYFKNGDFQREKFKNDFQFRVSGVHTFRYRVFEEGFKFTGDSSSVTLDKSCPVIDDLLDKIQDAILLQRTEDGYTLDFKQIAVDDSDEKINHFWILRDN